jgi:phospholipid/cholesterol/gamma-HCH transport system substrate-binding protein
MENKSHALAAGAFLLGVLALLVALAVWLARDTTEHRIFELSSREGVNGLQPQAGVRYKGVSVGRVTAIELDNKVPGNVLVRIAVNDSVPITPFTFATLGFQGVTGLAFIQLDEAAASSPGPASGRDPFGRIPMRPGMISRLSEQGTGLLTQLEQAAANIGQLNLPQLVQDASVSLKSMRTTSERLAASADSVNSTAAEFKRLSVRMSEPGGTLDKIAEGSNALVATSQALNSTLVPRLNRTVEDAARAVRQVERAADTVNENPQSLLVGKGAALPGPGESGFVAPAGR